MRLCLASIFLLAVLNGSLAIAATLQGQVVGVSDGDTVTVLDASRRQHRVRLAGIDAPEKKQAFGARSQHSLSEMVFRKQVIVSYGKTDRYGRIVGKVLLASLDVGLEQVKLGMAWHYKAYEREQSTVDRLAYAQAEVDAQSEKRGLWRDARPVPPWDFRRMR